MAISQVDYQVKPNESIPEYNARIAKLRDGGASAALGTSERTAYEQNKSAQETAATIAKNQASERMSGTGGYIPKSDTVTSNATIIDNVIPGLSAKLDQEAKGRTTTTDEQGLSKDAMGNYMTAPQGATQNPETGAWEYGGKLYGIAPEVTGASLYADQKSLLAQVKADSDPLTQREISNIQAKYSYLEDLQKKINESRIASLHAGQIATGAIYSPETSAGRMAEEASYGVAKLGELVREENELILKAQQAQSEADWKKVNDLMEKADTIRKEKQAKADKINEALTKSVAEQNKNLAISEAFTSGVTDPKELASRLAGAGVEMSDINAFLKQIAEGTGGTTGQISNGVEAFYNLKSQTGGLPADILALPDTGSQLFEFLKRYNAASASAQKVASTAGVSQSSVTQELLDMIDAGKIDPNRINSRTISLYNDIAKAGVDAVGAHAGSAAETKAVQDLTTYKSAVTRTLLVLDQNMPLVVALADKVNKTGIPGLDSYVAGIKAYTGNNLDVIKYVNTLKTLRSEYAQMLSRGAVATEGDKREAAEAIPAGLSGAGYQALADQLKLEANNILKSSDEAIQMAKDKSGSNVGTNSKMGGSTYQEMINAAPKLKSGVQQNYNVNVWQ